MQQNRRQVGQYEIQLDKEIGSGAYGKVYECQNLKDRNIKLCAKIVQIVESEEKNLQREQQINELISQQNYNPNLVRVFYVGQEIYGQGKVLVFIMEKCDSNLQKLMDERSQQNKPFTSLELDSMIKQILFGYSVLYEKNIVHRDIKPENILIKYDQNQIVYKLADFGVGKVYKANDFKMTKAGTPVFASPEINVIYQDTELDQAFSVFSKEGKTKSCVDIFSIGIILYKLALNTYPFPTTKEGIIQFFRTIKTTPVNVNIPQQIHKQMIEAMLKYYPQERATFTQLFSYYQIPFNTPIFQNKQKILNQSNQGFNNNQYAINNQQQNFKNNNFPGTNQNNNNFQQQNNLFNNNNQAFNQQQQQQNPNNMNQPQQNFNNINWQKQNSNQQQFNPINMNQPVQNIQGFNNQFQQNLQRMTNPINLKFTINSYIKIFLMQYNKLIKNELIQLLLQINQNGITNQEQLQYIKNYFFPIKKEELQSFRPEHIAFLYSIACLDKNFQEQIGTSIQAQQIEYLNNIL